MTGEREPKIQLIATAPDAIPLASDGLGVPTFYVDYVRGTVMSSGVAKINFVDNRLDAIAGEIRTVHVVTLVTPIPQIRAWAHYLNTLADQQGLPSWEEARTLQEQEAQEQVAKNG